MMIDKEAIYDEQISPLMAQILAICKTHKIAMIASFAIPSPDDPDLHCTSALTADEYEPPEVLKACVRAIYRQPSVAAFTITTRK